MRNYMQRINVTRLHYSTTQLFYMTLFTTTVPSASYFRHILSVIMFVWHMTALISDLSSNADSITIK